MMTFKEDVLFDRKDLLYRMLKEDVIRLIRYSWFPPDIAAREWSIPAHSVFRLTAGPLLLTLKSGLILGFSSLPAKASITMWVERTEDGEHDKESAIIGDPDLFAIDVSDPVYSDSALHGLVGQKVSLLTILTRAPQTTKYIGLPCEAGLIMTFERGVQLVLSHGLHDDSDDFAIIFPHEILPDIVSQLKETAC